MISVIIVISIYTITAKCFTIVNNVPILSNKKSTNFPIKVLLKGDVVYRGPRRQCT